jgi:acetyltransferase-like isoleucine patch superfamily enzyme
MLGKPSLLKRILRRIFPTVSPYMITRIKDTDGKNIPGTRISSHTFIDHPDSLSLAQGVYIGHFNVLEASHGLTIEEGVQVTTHCVITTHSSHQSIRLYGSSYAGKEMIGYVKGSVTIGKYSFIGPHSTVMPGTIIGKGSLVHAYSYVKGEFPDFSIIGGNPAKVLGDTRTIDRTLLDQYPELNSLYNEWTN